MKYWLMKSEPSCYSIDDLKHEKIGMWDGVRNYQARNLFREMKKGDRAFFYHSSADVVGIVGVMEIIKEAYPDPTQFNPKADHYDPKSSKENPRWLTVDVKFIRKFSHPVTLSELKNDPFFKDLLVVRKGMRLSVQPVSEKHFSHILKLRSKSI